MALFNHATKEITAKLVYYGPGLCGKTTNLQWIHDNLAIANKSKLVSLATQTDRTLFFDFLPVELGAIRGMRTRMQIYTVPGQVFHEATRRMVLKGSDAVVFVADSQAAMLDANFEGLQSLRRNLLANEIDPAVPMVIQYNKRDLPAALPISVLNARLNPRNLPFFEAVASQGAGVEETLRGITKALFKWLSDYDAAADRDRGRKQGPAAKPAAREALPPPAPQSPERVTVRLPQPTVRCDPTADVPAPGPEAKPASPTPPNIRIKKQTVVVPAATPAPAPPVETPDAEPAAPESSGVFRELPVATAPSDPPPQGAGLSEDQWLYLLEGGQRGPIDIEDLVDLVLTSIPEDTKVWHPGLEGWVRANDAREIKEEIPPPLPIPGVSRGSIVNEEMADFGTVPEQFRTVLIADEDEAFRKYLAMPLAARGFTILEAADGSAAWLLAVQNRPWLVLADVSMPEVDGFEFCRRIRSHPLLSHIPLLFIAGSDKYKERYRALQIGADDFLTKQTKIREILMRIHLLLTRYSDLSDPQEAKKEGEKDWAFEGRIEVFGAPALLHMCAQGRLSGLLTALADDDTSTAATLGFRSGDIISATVGSLSDLDAAYSFLRWQTGSFQFTPGNPGEGEPLAQSVEHVLLEGCRVMDESARNRNGADGPSS